MRLALTVRGTVQGVGFRPFVRRIAVARGLTGFVKNGRGGVRIEVQGADDDVQRFEDAIARDAPVAARVSSLSREALAERAESAFEILTSDEEEIVAPVLPPDLATCAQCWSEVRDERNRRHHYPFTNCISCGPRFSIALDLPYDRARTSMGTFTMCEACAREYGDMDDRRYHAQPNACPACGPVLRWIDGKGNVIADGEVALAAAVSALVDGKIVALKGLGGFQLLCRADDPRAVATLRERKHRPHKPFAVLFRDCASLARVAKFSAAEEHVLRSPEAPIVLVARNAEKTADLCDGVACGSPYVGAMLPATPLHGLLLERVPGALVCTSGNVSEEPICITDAEALARLAHVADGFLTHDRPIVRPLDDSVVRVSRSQGSGVVRRARGYAPRCVGKIDPNVTVLAVGAHLKNTVTLGHAGALVPSQHLGDLEAPATRDLALSTIDDLVRFFDARPSVIACDLHPDYASTLIAEELASRWQIPIRRVQHHHAHIAACMAEHDLAGEEVFGLAWDGSGLGTDGTIWGGEALVCRDDRFTRFAHLRPFPLLGGDLAARDPRRAALGLLHTVAADSLTTHGAAWFGDRLGAYVNVLDREVNAPRCSSMGRLFDAVAALLGAERSTFEGQAAMDLEALAATVDADGEYRFTVEGDVVDSEPVIRSILEDSRRNVAAARIARRFHEGVVRLGVDLAEKAAIQRVALGGGCFQNRLVSEGLTTSLTKRGFDVVASLAVPPNDGGISVGQAWIASRGLARRRDS